MRGGFSEQLREALVVKSNEIGGGDTAAEVKRVVLEMLKVGNTITVCGRAFSVYARRRIYSPVLRRGRRNEYAAKRNERTRKYFSRATPKMILKAASITRSLLSARKGHRTRGWTIWLDLPRRSSGVGASALRSGHQKEISRTRRGGLRFYATWKGEKDEREDATDDEKRMFCVHYFLADDTVEVIEKGDARFGDEENFRKYHQHQKERRKQKENRRYRHQHHLRNR